MSGAENYSDKTEIASPANLSPSAGDTVGTYRLIKQLGTGGMGSVFLAEHISIGRRVAMKFLLAELCQYPDIVGRFFDEARSVNRINHENIVEVFDFVREPSGLSYLVMELLEGTDLYQTRKRDGPYPLDRVLVICEQVASALFAAHKVGIIHRDLKPENAFLIKKRGNRDFVKLLDFGLAKLSDELPIARMPTQAGIVMGTPGYMSPEQAHGTRVDGRSDVFSLGILMHWMLADKVPEGGPNSVAPQRSVRGDDIPEQLRDLITSCIRQKPDERPASMGDVTAILTELRRQIRGTEVLQVVSRTASQSRTRSASGDMDATQVQGGPSRARTTEEIPVMSMQELAVASMSDEVGLAANRPTRAQAPSARLLWLTGLGSATFALVVVGIAYLIFGPTRAPPGHLDQSSDRQGADRPLARTAEPSGDHPDDDSKALTPPSSDLPHLPSPTAAPLAPAAIVPNPDGTLPASADDDISTPKSHGKKKLKKKPLTPHP